MKAPEVKRPEPQRPSNPPLKQPPVDARPARDDRPIERPAPSVVKTPSPRGGETGKPRLETAPAPQNPRGSAHFTSDTVHGVPVLRTRDDRGDHYGARGRGRGGDRDCDDYDRYSHHVARCNGWYGAPYGPWSDCGPCGSWQRYSCSDGFSLSVGFGSGFSFGFFYGSSCAPLCSSWCNPWWDGYASSWSCAPYAWRWRTYCRPYWYSSCSPVAYGCGPCPIPAWTPCYAWAPVVCSPVVYSPVVYTPVVYAPPAVAAPPAVPNPDAMWAFLADGYDRDAEDGFVLLEAAYPEDARWTIGQGLARALRGDTLRAADLLRGAFAGDPSAVTRLSRDPKFIARLEALERSLAPAANAARPSIDALLVIAASQAARGALHDAYLNATTAQAEGDRGAGVTALVAWLRAELRATP